MLNELSKQLLSGSIQKEKEIVLDMFDKKLVFRNGVEEKETTSKKKSSAILRCFSTVIL